MANKPDQKAPACTNCGYIADCEIVTVSKLETGYVCRNWTKSSTSDIEARESIINDFGPWALGYGVDKLKPSALPTVVQRRRKKYG